MGIAGGAAPIRMVVSHSTLERMKGSRLAIGVGCMWGNLGEAIESQREPRDLGLEVHLVVGR